MNELAHAANLDLTAADIQAATSKAYKKLLGHLAEGYSAQEAIALATKTFEGQYYEVLSSAFSRTLDAAIGVAELRDYPVSGLALSDHLYHHSREVSANAKRIIENHAKGFHDARKLSLSLFEGYGFKDADGGDPLKVKTGLPKYLNRLLRDPQVRTEVRTAVARARASALKTPALRAAYIAAIDKIQSGAGQEALAKSLKTAWYERNRYYANRIAQTELHRAYTDKRATELMGDPDITVLQWRLSKTHDIVDICDLHAAVNKYGLGPGCYPKESAPKPPAHPFCRCILAPRLDLDADGAKEKANAERTWLKQVGAKKGAQVMGSKAKLAKMLQGESLDRVLNEGVHPLYHLKRVGQFALAPPAGVAMEAGWKTLAKAAGPVHLALSVSRTAAKQAKLAAAAQSKAEAAVALKAMAKAAGKTHLAQAEATALTRAAAWQLDSIKAWKGAGAKIEMWQKKALGELEAIPGFAAGSPQEQLAVVKAKAEQIKAEALAVQKQKLILNGAKKNLAAGKSLSAEQQAVVDALPPIEQAKLVTEAAAIKDMKATATAAAKAAASPATVAQAPSAPIPGVVQTPTTAARSQVVLKGEGWVKYANKKGSNEGGFFKSPDGQQFYVKLPETAAHARNELLANRLYKLAGIDVPEVDLIEMDGRLGIASRLIPDVAKDGAKLAKTPGSFEGFSVDAWLANWDVVGLEYDNLVIAGGKAWRIDPGGSLLFRAMGAPKGAAFGTKVSEFETFFDANLNAKSKEIFGAITKEQIERSAARVLFIDDAEIRAAVDLYGPGSPEERRALANVLVARKADVAARYPNAVKIAADARKAAAASIEESVRQSLKELDANILLAVKGIAARAMGGGVVDVKDVDRLAAAKISLADFIKDHSPKMEDGWLGGIRQHYDGVFARLDTAVARGVGGAFDWEPGWTFNSVGATVPLKFGAGVVSIRSVEYLFQTVAAASIRAFTGAEAKAVLSAVGTSSASYSSQHIKTKSGFHLAAMRSWTSNFFASITKPMITGRATQAQKDYVDLVREALFHAGPKYKGKAVRGLNFNSFGDAIRQRFIKEHIDAAAVGGIVNSPVPMSHTRGDSTSGYEVVLHYNGGRGVHVPKISHYPVEDEVLVPPGEYRVVGHQIIGTVHHFWTVDP